MTLSQDVLTYVEEMVSEGFGMPSPTNIALTLETKRENVYCALETLAIHGAIRRINLPTGSRQRIAYEIAPRRRIV